MTIVFAGMSYVAGMLLMQMAEIDAFWCLVTLLERPRFLKGYYDANLVKIQRHARVFQKLLNKKLPKLAKHLVNVVKIIWDLASYRGGIHNYYALLLAGKTWHRNRDVYHSLVHVPVYKPTLLGHSVGCIGPVPA